jgi:hypothetical protein
MNGASGYVSVTASRIASLQLMDLDARWVSTHLNPPRVRVIIATLVNRQPSLPGGSAAKVAMIGAWSPYSAHSSWSRVPHTYGLATDANK